MERFFLYDNGSGDNHREVLAPYVDEGVVVVHDWPLFPAGQVPAYDHCLEHHGNSSRWIGFIDLDEFLFSPIGRPLPEVLVDYESWPGVGVNRTLFLTSGHRERPSGLVLENFVERATHTNEQPSIKSIIDPSRVDHCLTPHVFAYMEGSTVDEHHNPVESGWTASYSYSFLRINHYFTKSETEFVDRSARGWATGEPRPQPRLRYVRQAQTARDETILMYLPALRAALER